MNEQKNYFVDNLCSLYNNTDDDISVWQWFISG